MKSIEAIIKTLTPAQRSAITDPQTQGTMKIFSGRTRQTYMVLLTLGAATLKDGSTNEFVIGKGWEEIDVSIQSRGARGPYGVVTKDISCLVEKEVIPDAPKKKIQRPPAVYSNRSHNELIDHVLKNY